MDIVLKLKLDDKEYDATIVDADKQLAALRKQADTVGDSMGKWGQIVTGFNQALELSSKIFTDIRERMLKATELEVLRREFRGSAEDLELFRIATSRTVKEGDLIKLSNQATDLGISLKEQAILFTLADNSADRYGTTIEAGFMKVMNASEGADRGIKSLGIQTAVYKDIVDRMAKAQGDTIENLDAETQKQIRLKAIIEASGITIDDVRKKTQDNNDKLVALNVSVDEAREKMGLWLSEQLIPLVDVLGKSEEGTFGLRDAVVSLTAKLPDLLILLSGMKYILGGKALGTLGKSGGIAGIAALLGIGTGKALEYIKSSKYGTLNYGIDWDRVDNDIFGSGTVESTDLLDSTTPDLSFLNSNKRKVPGIGVLTVTTPNPVKTKKLSKEELEAIKKANAEKLKEQQEFEQKLIKLEEDYVNYLVDISINAAERINRAKGSKDTYSKTGDAGKRYLTSGGKPTATGSSVAEMGDRVITDAEDIYAQMDFATQGFIDGMMGMTDAFWANFIMTGRQAKNGWDALWLAFSQSAIQKIAQISANALFDSLTGGGKKKKGGGGFDFFGGLLSILGIALAPSTGGASLALAEGGIITRPTFALAGEAGAEAFIPLHKLNSLGLGGASIEAKLDQVIKAFNDKQFEIDNNKWRTVNKTLDVIERQKSIMG